VLKDPAGILIFPDTKKDYEDEMNCTWLFEAPRGYVIHLAWLQFDIEQIENCSGDFVEILEHDPVAGKINDVGRLILI
jgi:hypothetical protein